MDLRKYILFILITNLHFEFLFCDRKSLIFEHFSEVFPLYDTCQEVNMIVFDTPCI